MFSQLLLTVWILFSTNGNMPEQNRPSRFLSFRVFLEQAQQYLESAPLLFVNMMYDWCSVSQPIKSESFQPKENYGHLNTPFTHVYMGKKRAG